LLDVSARGGEELSASPSAVHVPTDVNLLFTLMENGYGMG
jgi:hypothetical protein